MTVYQTMGSSTVIEDTGSTIIFASDAINPLSGSLGVNTIKVINSSANVCELGWTNSSTVYEFTTVPFTTDSVAGADAEFNVTVTVDGYIVTIAAGGVDYLEDDSISILGDDVGGTSTANDLSFTVTSVDGDGAITGISSITGGAVWPQTTTNTTLLLPLTESFIQVATVGSLGVSVEANVGTGNVYIQPVAIVG